MLYKSFKMLHLVGIVMFLGSIFGHVATSVLGGPPGGSPEFVAARENISALTRALTLPGLGLAVIAGLAMALIARLDPLRVRWLGLHGALGLVIVMLTATIVVPAGRHLREAALSARAGAPSLPAIQNDLLLENVFGSVNIALALIAMAVTIWRPFRSRP